MALPAELLGRDLSTALDDELLSARLLLPARVGHRKPARFRRAPTWSTRAQTGAVLPASGSGR
jgi:hypothetical protein